MDQNFINIYDKNTGKTHSFYIAFTKYDKYLRIYIPDVCVIYIYKIRDHCYHVRGFFYKYKFIYTEDNIKSKKDLIRHLNMVIQKNIYE